MIEKNNIFIKIDEIETKLDAGEALNEAIDQIQDIYDKLKNIKGSDMTSADIFITIGETKYWLGDLLILFDRIYKKMIKLGFIEELKKKK